MKCATKCAQDLADVPPAVFRLPSDGKKWNSVARERRAVLQRMALAANSNGSSIKLSAGKIAAALGISRASILRRLAELQTLGFLESVGLDPKYRTTIRAICIEAVKKAWRHPSQIAEAPVSDNLPTPSQIAPDSTVEACTGRDTKEQNKDDAEKHCSAPVSLP